LSVCVAVKSGHFKSGHFYLDVHVCTVLNSLHSTSRLQFHQSCTSRTPAAMVLEVDLSFQTPAGSEAMTSFSMTDLV